MISPKDLYAKIMPKGDGYIIEIHKCSDILNRALKDGKLTVLRCAEIAQHIKNSVANAFDASQYVLKLLKDFNYKCLTPPPGNEHLFRLLLLGIDYIPRENILVEGPVGYFQLTITEDEFLELITILEKEDPTRSILKAKDIYLLKNGGTLLLKKTDGFFSPLNPTELHQLIFNLPKHLKDKFNSLNLPSLTEEDIIEIDKKLTLAHKQVTLHNLMEKQLFPVEAHIDPEGKDICFIQGEYGVADSNCSTPFLGTYGAGPCIILMLWHPAEQNIPARGVMAHIDALTTAESVFSLMKYFEHYPSGNKPVVYLTGGNESFSEQAIVFFEYFQTQGCTVHCAINKDISSAMLDVNSGKVTSQYRPSKIDPTEEARMQMTGLRVKPRPISCNLDGTTYIAPPSVAKKDSYNPQFFNEGTQKPRGTDELGSASDPLPGLK